MATLKVKDITPMDGYIVVAQVEAPEKTESGIYLPGNKESLQEIGAVIAVSKSFTSPEGHTTSCPVKVGDVVLFKTSYSSDLELKVENKSIHLLKYSSVVATL